MLIWIFSFYLMADYTDHLLKGQPTSETKCVLCGGRFLCGAVDESLHTSIFDEKKSLTLISFCKDKNASYTKQTSTELLWVSEEAKRFQELKGLLEKVVKKRSISKYTKHRIESITDEKLALRLKFRLQNGFPYKELAGSIGKKKADYLKKKNYLLPVISFESYKNSAVTNKKNYYEYLENLIAAPIIAFQKTEGGYAFISESNARLPANNTPLSEDVIEKKSNLLFRESDLDSFMKKVIRYPKEYCEKMGYKEMIQANKESIKKLAITYGGQSPVEQNYYYKRLSKKFTEMRGQKINECRKSMNEFLTSYILTLPNPEVEKLVKKYIVTPRTNSRMPSSISPPKPVYCEFNINNYKEECK